MNQPLCSIIIPTYNHGKYIGRSVASALAQTYTNIEVIVIDDGSTDDTSQKIQPFAKAVNYHKKINAGLGAARNTGIEISKGEYLQFLDADDYIEPSKIEKQLKRFQEDGKLTVVYSDCSCTDASGSMIENVSYPLQENENPIPVLLKRSLFAVHAGLIKRSAVIEAGRFDESRFAQEDWDLWLRIALRKNKFKYVPGNLAHYDQQGSTMISNPVLMFNRTRHMMEKFLSDPLFIYSGRKNVRQFTADQSIILAKRAYNNGWWKIARRYFWKAIFAAPGKVRLKYWLCIPQAWARQIFNWIRGRKMILPAGLNG